MSKYKLIYTVKLRMAHYISYNLFDGLFTTWITVVILELIHAKDHAHAWSRLLDPNRRSLLPVVIHNNRANRTTPSTMLHSNFCPINFRW
jgi:hypothetical protein